MVLSKKFKVCAALYLGLNLAICADDINSHREASASGDRNPLAHSYAVRLPHKILRNEMIDSSPVGALVAMTGISTILLSLPGYYTGELIGRTAYKPAP